MRLIALVAVLVSGTASLLAQPRQPGPKKGSPPPAYLLVERFNRMSPEQRERMLSRLPAERKAAVEERLERFKNLPPEAKTRLREEFDHFQQLPPEKQETVRKTFRAFNQLPRERRPEVRRELHRLRRMPAAARQTRFSSEEFRHKFDADEQSILETLSDLLGPE